MSKIWKTLNRKTLLELPPWFDVLVEEVELPEGKIVSDYYQIRMPQYTAVFAITKDQKIMIMRCYRHALGKITLTMPGGMLEPNETPIDGMKREFLEETGMMFEQNPTKEWRKNTVWENKE